MEEEKVCSYCEEPIEDDDFRILGDESIVCSSCFEDACKQCAICKKYFIEDDMQFLDDENGTPVCEDCYEYSTAECAICEGRFLEDELTSWGDVRICHDCLEERCPSFDQKENEERTQEAYESFCEKYIGRHVSDRNSGTVNLDITAGDEAPVCYSLSVTIDQDGKISEISRLKASMLLSEWATGSDWRPYPVDSDDYEFWAEDLLEDNLEFTDDLL